MSSNQAMIRLSPVAWDNLQVAMHATNYTGRGAKHGLLYYLDALFTSNPTLSHAERAACWTDNRPDEYRLADSYKLSHGKFPQWLPGAYAGRDYTRQQRCVPRAHWDKIVPELLRLADHFFIGPDNSPPRDRTRATATLEAIGLGYLKPVNSVMQRAAPKYKQISRRHWELVF